MRNERTDIINELKLLNNELVVESISFPKAYCEDLSNVKAIVLGCDPSNAHTRNMEYVFGIKSDVPKLHGFFLNIESNLHEIGLTSSDIYVQNLCQNYFEIETAKNPIWETAAKVWIPHLLQELSVFPSEIPILMTAESIYFAIINPRVKKHKASDLYYCRVLTPIPAEDNLLHRPLIPFYRNRRKVDYHLSNPEWIKYKNKLSELFKHL